MENYLRQYKDLRKLNPMKIVCIGKKTNEALEKINDYEKCIANNSLKPQIKCELKI